MRNNIVTVEYNGGCYIRTPELMQYDYGQILHLSGFGLPSAFQVDFGTSQIAGETVQVIGTLDHVAIPDTLLQGAANIYAFIRLHTGADDGETVCVIELPVMARPEITGEEPTPVEQDLIDQLMAALAAGVAAAEAAAAQIERMSAEASTLPAGSPATAAWDAEHGKLLLGIPKGDTGAAGTTFTPSVSDDGMISWTNDGGKTNPASKDLRAAVLSTLRWVDKINPEDNSLIMRAGDSFWLRATAPSGSEFDADDTITFTIYTGIDGQTVTSQSATRSEVDGPPKNEIWIEIEPDLTEQLIPGDYAYSVTITLNGQSLTAIAPASLIVL